MSIIYEDARNEKVLSPQCVAVHQTFFYDTGRKYGNSSIGKMRVKDWDAV